MQVANDQTYHITTDTEHNVQRGYKQHRPLKNPAWRKNRLRRESKQTWVIDVNSNRVNKEIPTR